MISPRNNYPLSPLWWFWLPFAVALGCMAVNPFLNAYGSNLLYAENGILEDAQFLIAFAAAGVGIATLRFCDNPWLKAWVCLAILGSFFIGMEEISWGQQIFHWQSPQYFALHNDQDETNLHNMSSWLDQKPKILLRVCIFIGGIAIPLLRRYKPSLLPAKYEIIYPSDALFYVAILAIVTDYFTRGLVHLYDRSSEVCEFFIYLFILLYLVMLRTALKSRKD
jgi:hypothetical protein